MKITCQGTAYIQQLHISKSVHNIWHLNITSTWYLYTKCIQNVICDWCQFLFTGPVKQQDTICKTAVGRSSNSRSGNITSRQNPGTLMSWAGGPHSRSHFLKSCFYRESNYDPTVVQPVAYSLHVGSWCLFNDAVCIQPAICSTAVNIKMGMTRCL